MLRMHDVTNGLRKVLERFDVLPDDAIVPTKVTAAILGLSERTVRYHPSLPRRSVSEGRYGQRVGDIRKIAREGVTAA
jgi:hypothetical protein